MSSSGAFYDIEVAIQTQLKAISGAPYIDFENTKPYIPAIGTRYWRTNHIPGNSSTVSIDAMYQHVGLYQVDILCPTGQGIAQMMADMDAIADAFSGTNSLVSNGTKIQLNGVSRSRLMREESWLYGFVKINYVCYSIRGT